MTTIRAISRVLPDVEVVEENGNGESHWWVGVGLTSGQAGRAITSPDTETWTQRNVGGEQLYGVARRTSDDLLLAVGRNATRSSTNAGISWSDESGYTLDGSDKHAAAADDSVFVAVGTVLDDASPTGGIWVWDPGSGWTVIDPDSSDGSPSSSWQMEAVTTDGSRWVAAGWWSGESRRGRIYSSDNTTTWTLRESTATYAPLAVAHHDGRWVVGAASYDENDLADFFEPGATAVSNDGANWTWHSNSLSTAIQGLASNGDRWTAVGFGMIATSDDGGETWTQRVNDFDHAHIRGVSAAGDTWVAVTSNGRVLVSTDNAVTWSVEVDNTDTYYEIINYAL